MPSIWLFSSLLCKRILRDGLLTDHESNMEDRVGCSIEIDRSFICVAESIVEVVDYTMSATINRGKAQTMYNWMNDVLGAGTFPKAYG